MQTESLKMKLMVAFQTNKEAIFNETICILDLMLCKQVEDIVLQINDDVKPNSIYLQEAHGSSYIYYAIAGDIQWRYFKAVKGMIFWVNTKNTFFYYNGQTWLNLESLYINKKCEIAQDSLALQENENEKDQEQKVPLSSHENQINEMANAINNLQNQVKNLELCIEAREKKISSDIIKDDKLEELQEKIIDNKISDQQQEENKQASNTKNSDINKPVKSGKKHHRY